MYMHISVLAVRVTKNPWMGSIQVAAKSEIGMLLVSGPGKFLKGALIVCATLVITRLRPLFQTFSFYGKFPVWRFDTRCSVGSLGNYSYQLAFYPTLSVPG